MRLYGKLQFICYDQGTEFTTSTDMRWLRDQQVGQALIPAAKPWQSWRQFP